MSDQLSPPRRRDRDGRRRPGRRLMPLLVGMIATIGCWALCSAPALAIVPTTGTVTGTFTVPTGTGAPSDVGIELITPEGGVEADATVTNMNATTGSYTADNVAPGQYYVYFSDDHSADNVQTDYAGDGGTDTIQSASPITVTAGTNTNVAATALHAGAIISGSVSDANKANETTAEVYIYPVVNGTLTDPEIDYYGIEAPVALATGAWSAAGLPAGTYLVSYRANGSYSNGQSFDLSQVYASSGAVSYDYGSAGDYQGTTGARTTINFSVPALAIITGTVTGPAGPVFGDQLDSYDSLVSEGPSTQTAANGSYYMTVLPGTYKLEADAVASENLAAAWYGGAVAQAQATAFSASAGATVPNINIALGAGGIISGTVLAAQGGAPVGDIEVDVLDAQGSEITDGFTLPNGTYSIADVPAGTWYVRFDGEQATNGSFYATSYFGGALSEFGAAPVTVNAGQTTSGVNGFMLPSTTAPLGLPKASAAALSGLHDNKVLLRFNLAAGSGAGNLKTLTVALPKGFSWHPRKLSADLSLGAGVTYSYAIVAGRLVITLASGQPSVALSLKAGGISVTKAIEKAAGGASTKPKKKKTGKALAADAKAKKPKKPKDTIKSETIGLSVTDTAGLTTSLPITINKPS